ncbi:hypothetical protein [Moraxella cuniculi]|uniref:Uncharacterized protein n=1 Tax=Moraxella cuniculi TaxID=34061 RepID=A0A448GWR3_9GAMM|nr:hypothetical protein [Moraxella cuniculi]VEG13236.1 Uncharacterised protein [Moraxella cuniculi]
MNKLFHRSLLVVALGLVGVACTPMSQLAKAKSAQSSFDGVTQVENLQYINGLQSPEDLVQIPNTKWLIASGMANNSGLHLIDGESKISQR